MTSGGLVTRARRGENNYDIQTEQIQGRVVTQVFEAGVVIYTTRSDITDASQASGQCRQQHLRVHSACESGALPIDAAK